MKALPAKGCVRIGLCYVPGETFWAGTCTSTSLRSFKSKGTLQNAFNDEGHSFMERRSFDRIHLACEYEGME